MLSPLFDDDFGLLESVKDFAVEQLIPEAGVEALAVAVLPGRTSLSRFEVKPLPGSGSDLGRFGTHDADPLLNLFCDELRAITPSE